MLCKDRSIKDWVTTKNYRFGFLHLIGRANVGKSTLLNCLIGKPLSIISNKPQTTRKNIRGILTTADYQAVFIDSPGVLNVKNELQKRMLTQAFAPLASDLTLYLVEPIHEKATTPLPLDEQIIKKLNPEKTLLLLNKVDKSTPEQILRSLQLWHQWLPAKEIIPLSALKNKGTAKLLKLIGNYLPLEQAHYPKNSFSDANLSDLAAEFVREQAFRILRQELPYGLATETEKISQDEKLMKINVCIYISNAKHKKMVIGSKGEMLKKIGTRARIKIEKFVHKKVFLSLYIKQLTDWQNKASFLNQINIVKNEL